MQVVIDVPDEEYEAIKNCTRCTNWFAYLIKKGTPLPKGHGKLVDKKKLGLTDFEILMCEGSYKEGLKMLLEKIENAPTIIEADEVTE